LSENREKIVFVLPQLKTGGGVRVVVELSNALVQKYDYDVRIVIPHVQSDCSFFIDPNIVIEKIGKKAHSPFAKIKNILQMFFHLQKNYKDEIIITTDPIFSPMFMFFRFSKLYRYVQADDYRIFDDLLLLKNRFFLAIYKFFTKLSYKQNITYIFNSKFTHKKFVELKGKEVKNHIVHPSINHKSFYSNDLATAKDEVSLCLIARKHPMKRFEDFLTVYRRIEKREDIKKKIKKVFIISHDDLSQYDLKGMTLIVPSNDKEIADTMRKSDIYIFTSIWEGFGLPPLEAMACGCAVVASDAKGINEYARDGENALFYPPENTNILEQKLLKVIEDKALREKLQTNAIKTAKTFSWEKSAKQLLTALGKSTDV